jgi:hypothetical protein
VLTPLPDLTQGKYPNARASWWLSPFVHALSTATAVFGCPEWESERHTSAVFSCKSADYGSQSRKVDSASAWFDPRCAHFFGRCANLGRDEPVGGLDPRSSLDA